ncbi:hypothetical protein BC941DRAFT_475428 [Chlamydoabsidia padenii]|nr:hypothetical protein BC941DRAFT_475428 [Chlamydoabsidia padenii]
MRQHNTHQLGANSLELLTDPQYEVDMDRLIIVGDFNYSYHRPHLTTQTSQNWLNMLDEHLYNSMEANNLTTMPTFQRSTSHSTIDYIFISQKTFAHHLKSNSIDKTNSAWTDHNMLTIKLEFKNIPLGPGLWKVNPLLLKNDDFRQQLDNKLTYLAKGFKDTRTPHGNWDWIKQQIISFIKSYGRRHISGRSAALAHLQLKRQDIILSTGTSDSRQQRLDPIVAEINKLQQDCVDIAALQAGIRWREKGEISAEYLKKIHQQRNLDQHIGNLANTDTSTFDTSKRYRTLLSTTILM